MAMLFKYPLSIIGYKQVDIRLEGMDIRKRGQKIGKLGSVIPDSNIGRHLGPCLEIIGKIPAFFINRRTAIALDGAKCDQDIAFGPDVFWRFARVLISQRGNLLIRNVFLSLLSVRPDMIVRGIALIVLRIRPVSNISKFSLEAKLTDGPGNP